jgi:hypothetical protein
VQAKFPRLARQYDEWYRRNNGAPKDYADDIASRFIALRKKYGIESRPVMPMRPPGGMPQMSLDLPELEKVEPRFDNLPGMPAVQ